MELQLFPDLLSDVLNMHILDHYEEEQYHLFDADGKIVPSASLNEEQYQQIQMSRLPKGHHYIQVALNGN